MCWFSSDCDFVKLLIIENNIFMILKFKRLILKFLKIKIIFNIWIVLTFFLKFTLRY